MININLLPPSMRFQKVQREAGKPGSGSPLGQKILLLGIGGTLGILAILYVFLVLAPCLYLQMRLASWQRQWVPLEKQFNEVNVFATQEKQFQTRFEELAKRKKDRMRWAKLLNAISDVMPPSIQLVRISSGSMVEMVSAPTPPAKPGSTAPHGVGQSQTSVPKVKRTYQVLELEGLTEKGLLGEEDLNSLLEQMRFNDVFLRCFERIELVGVMTLANATKRFSLRCRFKETPS